MEHKYLNVIQAAVAAGAAGAGLAALVFLTLGWRAMLTLWAVSFIALALLVLVDKQTL